MSKTTNLQLFKHDEPLESNENDFDVGEALNDNWDILDTFAGQVDTRLETLENDLDEISTNLDTLETSIETIQSNVTSLQTDNETNKQNIQDLQTEQETQNTAIENNTEELELLKNNLPDPITTDQSEEITVQDAMNYYSSLDVSGNSTQDTRSGKNKLKLSDVEETTSAGGITYSVKDGVITLNGTSTRPHYINFKSDAIDLPANTYTMSSKVISGSYSGVAGKQLNDDTNSNILNGNYMQDTATVEIAEDKTGVYLSLYIGGTVVLNNYKLEIQLEEGTEATEYEKYGAMPSPDYPSKIKNCKTSINIKVENANKINLEEDDLNTYSYVVSNKSSNDITWVAKNGAYSWLTLKKYLKAGTYYLQRKYEIISGVDNLGQAGMLTVYTGDDKTLIKSIASNKEKDSFIITQDNYYNIHLIASNGTAQGNDITIRFYDLMLSEKDENYIEHKEQIIPFPLKEGQLLHAGDYLANDGTHHKKQTIVFDGDETVIVYDLTDEAFNNYSVGIHSYYKKMLSYQADDKCSHFINLGHTPSWGRQANTFALSTEYRIYLMFPKNVMTSADEVKSWITEQYNNGIPLTAEGTLEEEYVEPYTEEQQAAYNELQNLLLYKGYNYITCTDETKCKLQLTYRPDNNSKIKSLEERVSALENSEVTV